ncbi:unnamed protein product [Acanthoscelides obtectus]|uniref:BTB domain-containing protein n=1 Tax=Acanthoscelides obtectus TaxID=200917 RepID=A0A9P0M9R5_ACAOB|nr:unnamed protein product [Acanthoscelides obtectus]CAK1677014.1 hypothetical protein AOBTE_LOCUS31066 [Acanthoscelides obtectus]
MNETQFNTFLNALSVPQDSKSIYKLLVNIRKELDWPQHRQNILKIRSEGCLGQLVSILQMPQRYIMDVCLSILGNCMMDKGCARDLVGIHNIISSLNHILKHHQKSDSINGRIFRIIGNMCQHKKDQWATLVIDNKPYIVTHIVELLKKSAAYEIPPDEKYSEATLSMAIRTLRMLLNCRTVIPLVKDFGVLKAVGSLFIKVSTEWQEHQTNQNLLHHIIRLLYDYSRYKYYNSILEMTNTERGNALLHLNNVLFLSPKKIVKIIMNFIKISQLHSELPVTEICDNLVDFILHRYLNPEGVDTSNSSSTSTDYLECVQCLCLLLEHPANKTLDRCGKCVPVLIRVLDSWSELDATQLKCCILLVTTLSQCQYDDGIIREQLKHHVIRVLLKKLQWIYGTSNTLKENHDEVKIRNPVNKKRAGRHAQQNTTKRKKALGSEPSAGSSKTSSPSTSSSGLLEEGCLRPTLRKQYSTSPSSSDDEYCPARYDRSPSPCSSIGSDLATFQALSPRRCSLSPTHDDEDEESDSDDYSPVCSDAEDDKKSSSENEEDDSNENQKTAELLDDIECDNEEDSEEKQSQALPEEPNIVHLKSLLVTEIAILISCIIRVDPKIPELGTEEMLVALLKCSTYFKPTVSTKINTVDIVLRILDSAKYLIPLMKTKFIETIYDLTKVQHNQFCNKCDNYKFVGKLILRQMTTLAESGVGKGEIAYTLLRGGEQVKQQLLLVIPYIHRDKSLLVKYMHFCDGLHVLIKLSKNEGDLKKRAIKTLCMMAADKLNIANPKDVALNLSQTRTIKDKYKLAEDCEHIVSFKLDDGSVFQADRQFLSDRSEFFRGLLSGHFRESSEDVVRLTNVKKKSLACLLHLLKNLSNKVETVDIKQDLETLLDVLVLSDRFLLSDICDTVVNSVEKFRISARNVPMIYRWSLESGTNLLRVESVAFALVVEISDAERFKMFNDMFQLGYTEELTDDIHTLLARYLYNVPIKMKVRDLLSPCWDNV